MLFLWRRFLVLFPWMRFFIVTTRLARLHRLARLVPVLASWTRCGPRRFLVLFLVLFLAVVRNTRVPYFIRYSVLQAILVDIVLVLINLAFGVLRLNGDNFAGRTLSNTVFLGILVLVGFGVVESLRGKEADIPTVSDAVRMQLN